MDEYIRRENAIEWFMPYEHVGESIDADVVISDIKGMKAADVAPVRHARWVKIYENGEPKVEQHQVGVFCSKCMNMPKDRFTESDYCPNCGAKMDGELKESAGE